MRNQIWLFNSFLSILRLFACLGADDRLNAFINYSEVSRIQGDINPADVVAVALESTYGQIRLQLRRDWAPKACAAVADMAAGPLRACPGCTFYRHEPIPQNWGIDGFMGPPYSLLQGGLPGLNTQVELENAAMRAVLRGNAAFIPGTADFFIGTADHNEWGGAFTVFAEVVAEDMASVVSRIPVAPYRNSTDQYNITTRWLEEKIPFRLRPILAAELMIST